LREINERSAHLAHDGCRYAAYDDEMSGTRTMLELVRAFCVLALLFLNFAHQPAFAAQSAGDVLSVVASQSFCGTPIGDDQGHAPCHACRIGGGADLPPVCAVPRGPLPVALRLTGIRAVLAVVRFDPGPVGARGPPTA
jgi:hypothetical protein